MVSPAPAVRVMSTVRSYVVIPALVEATSIAVGLKAALPYPVMLLLLNVVLLSVADTTTLTSLVEVADMAPVIEAIGAELGAVTVIPKSSVVFDVAVDESVSNGSLLVAFSNSIDVAEREPEPVAASPTITPSSASVPVGPQVPALPASE